MLKRRVNISSRLKATPKGIAYNIPNAIDAGSGITHMRSIRIALAVATTVVAVASSGILAPMGRVFIQISSNMAPMIMPCMKSPERYPMIGPIIIGREIMTCQQAVTSRLMNAATKLSQMDWSSILRL